LGIPWLTKENPQINWKNRTIKIGKVASKDLGENLEHSDYRIVTLKNHKKETQEENILNEIGGNEESILKERKYQEELESIRQKLPAEIRDFVEVQKE
jgi:hypothetical protein